MSRIDPIRGVEMLLRESECLGYLDIAELLRNTLAKLHEWERMAEELDEASA